MTLEGNVSILTRLQQAVSAVKNQLIQMNPLVTDVTLLSIPEGLDVLYVANVPEEAKTSILMKLTICGLVDTVSKEISSRFTWNCQTLPAVARTSASRLSTKTKCSEPIKTYSPASRERRLWCGGWKEYLCVFVLQGICFSMKQLSVLGQACFQSWHKKGPAEPKQLGTT
ncbi:hypothetical protein PsorP6_011423 [Peronosclerospora sorghi]|uniref:Uncharacterized protein n=1 Tax=Peronosclerospora sorghi TaxID=230839 RepID=A0ACC0WKQ2_9STRA|nr:hypothetical protein PsorP6_011423 [Peronosclerospora sorghi]